MPRHFGQNAFATVSGVVTTAGLAVCLATGQGQIEVIKRTTGATASVVAQIQGTQYRIRKIPVLVAQSQASAQGYAKADWQIAGTVNASVTAYGRSKADFYAAGIAEVLGYMGGSPYRLAKVRAFTAKGEATLEGSAYTFQMLKSVPAVGTATLYGTTYHLAYGTVAVSANAQGQMKWTAGAKAHAEATAECTGQAEYTIALYGQEASVEAYVSGHEAVTRSGVRYLDAYGKAVCTVAAENSHIAIYPSVTAFVTANMSGRALYILGGQGHAQSQCSLSGTMIAAATAVTLVQGDTQAQATGRIRALHRFKGEARSQAVGNGTPLVTHTGVSGTGSSAASGSGTVQVQNTKVYPDTGYGVALIRGQMNRIKSVAGAGASVYSQVQVHMQRVHIGYGIAYAEGLLTGKQYRIRLFKGTVQANVTAQILNIHRSFEVVPAVGNAQLFGQLKRDQFMSGEAVATATSNVGVQVNDVGHAPNTRTMQVLNDPRTVVVPKETRIIVV